MQLHSQDLRRVLIWAIRFVSSYIPPLNAWLHRLSQRFASTALESYLRGELEAAVADYCKALQWEPLDARLHSALGQVYSEQGKLDDAVKQFEKALDYDYQDLRALKGLGSLLLERGDFAKAAYTYLRYLEVEPRDALVLHNLGATFHNMGNFQEALSYYALAEKEGRVDALLRRNQALTLIALGRTEEAADSLLQAAKLEPQDGEVDRLLGSLLEREQKYDEALARYKSATEKDPQNAEAHFAFAALCTKRDNPGEAVKHARIAADLFRERGDWNGAAKTCWALGWEYYLLNEFEKSLEASTEALRFDPNQAGVYFNIGLVLLHLGRKAEAHKRYKDGLQKLTQIADLKYYAIDDLQNALSKNPQLAGGAEMLEMLQQQYATKSRDIASSVAQST